MAGQVGWEQVMESARGLHEAEYKRILASEGYSGWLHIGCVQACPGGYTWHITSDLYRDGVVVRRSRLGAHDEYRAPDRDMAAANAAIAMESIMHSRGGEAIHAD